MGAFAGLNCAATNALPSRLVVLEPGRLQVISSVVPPEPVTGRITFGGSFIYAAGRDHVFRFRYRHGRVALDRRWGPVVYRTGAQRPGTGPGLLGDFLVVQTNFLPAAEPLTVTAVEHPQQRSGLPDQAVRPIDGQLDRVEARARRGDRDDRHPRHLRGPHGGAASRSAPRAARELAAQAQLARLLGPDRGRPPPSDRDPDLTSRGDTVVWLSERTGREVARTKPLAPASAPGNIVTPGFDGRFYYLSGAGRLWELSTDRRNAAAESSTPGNDRPAERSYGGSRPSEKEAAPS